MDGRRGFKDRRLRSMTKCHICGKKFMTVQALKSHEGVHRAKSRSIIKNKLSTRVAKQKVAVPQIKSVAKKADSDKKAKNPTKTVFKCPRCSLSFQRYFEALKHIQKIHCVDANDEPVSLDSPNLIKPILIVKCTSCNMHINKEPHLCYDEGEVSMYKCLGCSQTHNNLYYFDQHLSRMHSEGVESMFFPTEIDFLSWMQHMQSQTNTKYSTMKDYNEKQIYKCHRQETVDSVRHMCPSSIITQKFANGIQVHFYKKHYSHSVHSYQIGMKFKKYSITNFVKVNKKIKEKNKKKDEDLYVHFKNVMEGIVVDAAKINITSLKVLLEKAYEMTLVLNSYNEDDEQDVPMDRPLLDDQITLALEENLKKPAETPEVVEKKKKVEDNATEEYAVKVKKKVEFKKKIVEIKINEETQTETKADEVIPPNPLMSTPKPNPGINIKSPSSFNDSYKNFVGYNLQSGEEKVKLKPKTVVQKDVPLQQKKKRILKTKIGQFKPSLSPKNTSESKVDDPKVKFRDVTEMEYEVKERENDCNILILKF